MKRGLLKNNLVIRVYTSSILIPSFINIIIKHKTLFDLLLTFIFIISCYEIISIINSSKKTTLKNKTIWIVVMVLYILLSLLCLKYTRSSTRGYLKIIILFFCIWIFDSSGYLFGSWIKGPKMCTKISPQKTWSGFTSSIIITFFIPHLFFIFILNKITRYDFRFFTSFCFCLMGMIGQIGDLTESYFKRKFNAKDSGNIFPGHGGILDRFDSIYLSSIIFYVLSSFDQF